MRNREDNSSKGAAFVKMEASPHTCTRAYTLSGGNRRARLDRLFSHLFLWCDGSKSALWCEGCEYRNHVLAATVPCRRSRKRND
jgi:hypothetical protein